MDEALQRELREVRRVLERILEELQRGVVKELRVENFIVESKPPETVSYTPPQSKGNDGTLHPT